MAGFVAGETVELGHAGRCRHMQVADAHRRRHLQVRELVVAEVNPSITCHLLELLDDLPHRSGVLAGEHLVRQVQLVEQVVGAHLGQDLRDLGARQRGVGHEHQAHARVLCLAEQCDERRARYCAVVFDRLLETDQLGRVGAHRGQAVANLGERDVTFAHRVAARRRFGGQPVDHGLGRIGRAEQMSGGEVLQRRG